jgi:hypothetical protein
MKPQITPISQIRNIDPQIWQISQISEEEDFFLESAQSA